MTRADLDKRPQDVAAMFDQVAARYDRMNTVMTLGQDRLWRRAVARAVGARAGERVLDLAAGTATSSTAFTTHGARVVGVDFSLGMLRAARPHSGVDLVAGDALHLPFADASFDCVTASFGLRNVADLDSALAELRRVTRAGGRLVVCETSRPVWPPARTGHRVFVTRVLPRVARRFSSDPAAYDYLAESMLAWPSQRELADRIAAAGWTDVRWRNLSLGTVAVHTAHRR